MLLLKSDEYVGPEKSVKVLSRTPQQDYPEHCHDFSELVLVRSGSGIHIVNGHQSVLLPNTIACVSEKDYHLYADNKDVTLLNILYNKSHLALSRVAADIIKRFESQHSHFIINDEAFNRLFFIGQQIRSEQDSNLPHSQMMVSLLFEQLLLFLERLDSDKYQANPVMQAVIYLCNNFYDQNLSVHNICDIFKITSKSLNSELSQLTGMSTNRYINQLRIRKAMILLKKGLSITDVAYQVGYNDSNYFSTKFKTVTGQLPTAYVHQLAS